MIRRRDETGKLFRVDPLGDPPGNASLVWKTTRRCNETASFEKYSLGVHSNYPNRLATRERYRRTSVFRVASRANARNGETRQLRGKRSYEWSRFFVNRSFLSGRAPRIALPSRDDCDDFFLLEDSPDASFDAGISDVYRQTAPGTRENERGRVRER